MFSKFVLRQRQCQRQKKQRRINVPERNNPTVLAVLGMIIILIHACQRGKLKEN